MTRKIVVVAILIAAVPLCYLIYRHFTEKTLSLGAINARARALEHDANMQIALARDIVSHFTRDSLTNELRQQTLASLPETTYLSKEDTTLLESLRELKATADSARLKAFVQQQRLPLYRLFVHALNQQTHARVFDKTEEEPVLEDVTMWLANNYNALAPDSFFINQKQFYLQIAPQDLKKKLLLEACVAQSWDYLVKNAPDSASWFIGEGLLFAQKLGDESKKLLFLTRAQYLLIERLGMAHAAIVLGDFVKQLARESFHQLVQARACYYNGNAFIDLADYAKAKAEFDAAFEIYQKYDYRRMLRLIYGRLGVTYRHLGQFRKARKCYNSGRNLNEKPNPYDLINYHIGLGLIDKATGDFRAAIEKFHKSLRIARKIKSQRDEAVALNNLAEVHLDLGNYGATLDFYDRALALDREKVSPFSVTTSMLGLTETYITLHSLEKARETARMAKSYLGNHGFTLLRAQSYANLGRLNLRLHDFEAALTAFRESLAAYRETGEFVRQIESLNLIGDTQRRMQQYTAALTTLDGSASLAQQLPELAIAWTIDSYRARVYRDLDRRADAEKLLASSIEKINAITDKLTLQDRPFYAEKIQPVFEQMVLLQLDKKTPTSEQDAFYFSEHERAKVMSIMLHESRRRQYLNASEPEEHRQAQSPNKADVKANIDSLQNRLQSNSLVIKYEVTEQRTVVWAITPTEFAAHVLDLSRDQVERLVGEQRKNMRLDTIEDDDQFGVAFRQSQTLTRSIYASLIAPLEPYLENAEVTFIIPDEALNYLPFSALIDKSNAYLLQKTAVTYAASAAILQQTLAATARLQTETPERTILAIATGTDAREVDTVADMHPQTTRLTDDLATEEMLARSIQKAPTAVLFATHGFIDERNPNLSALRLREGPDSDGYLVIAEMMALDLDSTEIVYAASCESAIGKRFHGEGMINLNRAFMVAGSDAVVANLWKVDAFTTSKLTSLFFEHWLGGMGKAKALQKAQLDMIGWLKKHSFYSQPHPYFWAPAILTGAHN